jgi:hypothetical protein
VQLADAIVDGAQSRGDASPVKTRNECQVSR